MKAQSIFVSIVATLALGTVACAPATSADLSAELGGAPYEVETVAVNENFMSEEAVLQDILAEERGEGALGEQRAAQCTAQQERCVQKACTDAGGSYATNCQPMANGGARSICHGDNAPFIVVVGPYSVYVEERGI